MSVLVMPQHDSAYFTCDYLGGKSEHRSTCRAGVTIRPDQGGLWMNDTDVLPDEWRRVGRAHLCPEHRDETSICSLVWPLTEASTSPGAGSDQ